MAQSGFTIREPKRIVTGADGGRVYVTGRCIYNEANTFVTVLFTDSTTVPPITGGPLYVAATVADYSDSAGLLLQDAVIID